MLTERAIRRVFKEQKGESQDLLFFYLLSFREQISIPSETQGTATKINCVKSAKLFALP